MCEFYGTSEMTIINKCLLSQKVWHAKVPSLLIDHECRVYVKICSPSLVKTTSPYEWTILDWKKKPQNKQINLLGNVHGYLQGPVILAAVAERSRQWHYPYLCKRPRSVAWEGYTVCLIHIVNVYKVMSSNFTSAEKENNFYNIFKKVTSLWLRLLSCSI